MEDGLAHRISHLVSIHLRVFPCINNSIYSVFLIKYVNIDFLLGDENLTATNMAKFPAGKLRIDLK
jgi:hypothetical protein